MTSGLGVESQSCQLVHRLFVPSGRDWQKAKSKARVHSSEEQKDCLALERRGVSPYFLLGKKLVWLLPRLFPGMSCALFSVLQCI